MSDNWQRAQNIANYKRLFLPPIGRAVLDDLASEAMIDSSTFDPNPQVSAYNQGKRDLVLGIFAKLNINLKDYLTSSVPMEDI